MSNMDKIIEKLAGAIKQQVKGLEQVYVGGKEEILGVKGWLKTGILSIDWILGGKGLPLGRAVECYGDFSSGKSWFGYRVLGQAQKQGMIAVLIETEGAFSPEFAKQVGVDTEKLLVVSPDAVEDVFKVIGILFKENAGMPIVVVWDSIAATSTYHELEEGMDKRDMSKAGRMGQGLRMISGRINENGGMLLAINQVRDLVGVMYGPKETTPGGRAMEFHSSVRLKFSKAGKILNDEKEVIGQKMRIECTKSKICAPFKQMELEMVYGQEIKELDGVLSILKKKGLVVDNRGWNTFVNDTEKWRDSQFEEAVKTEVGKNVLKQIL